MQIDSDDNEVTAALERLRALVLAEGGGFSPQMITRVRGGDLTVLADDDIEQDARLMQVPASCLGATEAFDLGERDGAFIVESEEASHPETARRAFRQMLTVYNACGKPAAWRASSPWFALSADPELLQCLTDLRRGAAKIQKFARMTSKNEWTRLLVDSFIGARVFQLRPEAAEEGGDGDSESGTAQSVLMPYVDFLNHDFRARPYSVTTDADGVRRLWTYADRPLEESRECLVRYTPLDPFDSLLLYGFVDTSSAIARSVPACLHLADGLTLEVDAAAGGLFKDKLPKQMQDIRMFIPNTKQRDGDYIKVSWMLFPGAGAPWALRRVLRAFIRALRPQIGQVALREAVEEGEAQLLEANYTALNKLTSCVAAARAAPPADAPPGRAASLDNVDYAIQVSRARLEAYAGRLGVQVL